MTSVHAVRVSVPLAASRRAASARFQFPCPDSLTACRSAAASNAAAKLRRSTASLTVTQITGLASQEHMNAE